MDLRIEKMDTDMPGANQRTSIENPEVIYGHRFCQSSDSKWLCLKSIYPKFHRSNIYDIGGTYIQDVPDYWFTYKTEQVGKMFLLHMFSGNHSEGTFTIGLSNSSELKLNKKNNIAALSETLKHYTFKVREKKCPAYVTTYSFSDLDIELLKDRKLYIAISLTIPLYVNLNSEEVDNIKLQHDCRALLSDPVGADFTIESQDLVKFKVHKILLTSHSEVFKAMLREDTAESQSSHVRLVDVAAEDVRAMLEFIYTGTITDIENINFGNLLMLSDRYDLCGLRELSNHALSQQLSVDNALDTLIIADLHDSDSLKNNALKFIKKHRDALDSSTFNEFNNPSLMRELCAYLAA